MCVRKYEQSPKSRSFKKHQKSVDELTIITIIKRREGQLEEGKAREPKRHRVRRGEKRKKKKGRRRKGKKSRGETKAMINSTLDVQDH